MRENVINYILGTLILIGMTVLVCFSCSQDPTRIDYFKVVEVHGCNDATPGSFLSRDYPGECRVILENGMHVTVERPVMIGDEVSVFKAYSGKRRDGIMYGHVR